MAFRRLRLVLSVAWSWLSTWFGPVAAWFERTFLVSKFQVRGEVKVNAGVVRVEIHTPDHHRTADPDLGGAAQVDSKEEGSMTQVFPQGPKPRHIRCRGAVPTPRHKLAGAVPHIPTGPTPPQFAVIPAQLSYWLNNQYGDCVTAEEAFKCACYSPEILIADETVYQWARQNGVLNGADLLSVIQAMQQSGFRQDGNEYRDGSPSSVDFSNEPTLQNAISQGPVKIGVAAGQLENAVGSRNGWMLFNAGDDPNEDHCVSLCGYGPLAWCAAQLGVSVPAGLDPAQVVYMLFTWDTIGIIDHASIMGICGEAWLRTPSTVIVGPNPPAPTPPAPTPAPTPAPIGAGTLVLTQDTPAGTYVIANSGLGSRCPGEDGAVNWAQILQLLILILQTIEPLIPTPTPTPTPAPVPTPTPAPSLIPVR